MSDKQELSSAKIEQGWRDTFSTENPFCPCNLKSFTKAVRWAERAMLQAAPAEPSPATFRPTALPLTGTITAREIAEATGLPLHDDYKQLEHDPDKIERCPVCGSQAKLWQYSEDANSPVKRLVMCTHGDKIGPQNGLIHEGCLLYMPGDDFYRETARDAVRFWNEFAKALNALRRGNNWKHARPMRDDAPGVQGVATGDCGNAECGWRGPLSECSYLGAVGPCCPKCREIVEPDALGVQEGKTNG